MKNKKATSSVRFETNTASLSQILKHLKACSNDFFPPLGQKVDIDAYARKIDKNAVIFEAWKGKTLVGLVAAYFNDEKLKQGFITNVSTLKNYTGMGIATHLLLLCIQYAQEHTFNQLKLEVSHNNVPAITLYKKLGFDIDSSIDENTIMQQKF